LTGGLTTGGCTTGGLTTGGCTTGGCTTGGFTGGWTGGVAGGAVPIAKGIMTALAPDTEQSAKSSEANRLAVKGDFMMRFRGIYIQWHE
jgi:hypothetical protein